VGDVFIVELLSRNALGVVHRAKVFYARVGIASGLGRKGGG
jgi:hypothetical protein